jgi:serine protease Do
MSVRTQKLAWAAMGIFAIGAVSGWSAPNLLRTAAAPAAANTSVAQAPANTSAVPVPNAPIPLGTAPNYRAIVAQNQAAVVGISIVGSLKTAGGQSPLRGQTPFGIPFGRGDGDDDPFFRFFRGIPQQPGDVPIRAQGSGFIISRDGLILSNAHVVDGAKEVTVKLSDHREFKAKVLGADKTSDIAVLKIDARELPTVRIGDSDALSVGDYVLAIGAPFGLEETATAGIVSAKARALPGDGYVPFIQTDAAVNPGNSGGPLFDASGAVVGINSQIYSNSGGFQGVSFAIPINLARQVEEQIVKTGKVSHGRLGVQVQNIDQSLADSFKLNSPAGALVAKVEPGSAAADAGVKPGDVILEYNGTPVKDASALSMRVNTTAPGEKATLKIWRDGESKTLTARIRSATDESTADNSTNADDQSKLGLALRPLTKDEREQVGIEKGGLVVEGSQGRAAEAGIQQGDVLIGANGTPLESVDQLRKLAKDRKQIALLVQRGDNRIFVPLSLG